ncbi:ribbon-helix-helix protein, CopG family [uncultured Paludibaculum sp.]|uniref:ribbon-helix-helix protein, CopG family n=1 Tax=uncultured Paludibaculum sp. TaxID=1765020 RepID=UPI002AAB87C2|nr:ribbon-helix-helix protein, CopG family [uncultured Paludibaculum sp.]
MTLFNKRSKMVSIRLSDDEFRRLREVCEATGARSISDLAREAMHRLVDMPHNGHAPMESRLEQLDQKVSNLQARLDKLAESMEGS